MASLSSLEDAAENGGWRKLKGHDICSDCINEFLSDIDRPTLVRDVGGH
jgi:hypothetical protein